VPDGHHDLIRCPCPRRADIECFARDLEARGRARATITRRLCTVAGFYRYAVEEDLLDHSPGAHVRRPRLDYESHATCAARKLDRIVDPPFRLNGLCGDGWLAGCCSRSPACSCAGLLAWLS
jgi:site-specific recombinase XerD